MVNGTLSEALKLQSVDRFKAMRKWNVTAAVSFNGFKSLPVTMAISFKAIKCNVPLGLTPIV